jgi:hypothetical protein
VCGSAASVLCMQFSALPESYFFNRETDQANFGDPVVYRTSDDKKFPSCAAQSAESLAVRPGSIPSRGKRFFCTLQCPHSLWGPPNMLSNGYRWDSFLG